VNALFTHGNETGRRVIGPRQAALPFVALVIVFVAGASSSLLPAGLAFALAAGCLLTGSLRVLLAYRDHLVARRVPETKL
jgi:hypothetical protein